MNTSNTARSKTVASILATGALLWGIALPLQAAHAADGERAQRVTLTDLNLSTLAGQEAARERLHQTARQLCAQVEDDLDLSHQTNYLKCVEEATARTLPHLEAMIRGVSAIRTAAINQSPQ